MARELDAIFFDVDDTLFSTTRFAETARRNSIRAMINLGLDVDFEEAYRELLEVIGRVLLPTTRITTTSF